MVALPLFRYTNPGGEEVQTTGSNPKDKGIPVSEIFHSIQGEGIYAGIPSVFLRTYYCNLTCTFCDTKYTWVNQSKAQEGNEFRTMGYDDIINKLESFRCKHLVITGGEPLLHQRQINELCYLLKLLNYFIEIETNGTIEPTQNTLDNIDCFNVSPKTSNSNVEVHARTNENALLKFIDSGKAYFKFVISSPKDIQEVLEIVQRVNISRKKILLMPEADNPFDLKARSEWLIEECKKLNVRYSPRLHIQLYGNKRGF